MMGLFGKRPDPKTQVREWSSKLRSEQNKIERQINQIKREEEKVAASLKQAAKKGDKESCRILAKEVVRARKSVTKMHSSKARINSVKLQMENQLALVRVTGELERSTEVMVAMQRLIKIPEIQAAMITMSKEMTKAGIIEEMVEETMEQLEEDDIEEAADKEIENVLWELTKGQLGEAPEAVGDSLPTTSVDEILEDGAKSDDVDEMTARLASLRN